MITIVLPISRRDFLKPVFDCLKNLDKPKDTELLIITDGSHDLQMAVSRRLDEISFAHLRVINFGEEPAKTINERRHRISNIHNMARGWVHNSCDYVFLIEDDTTYPPDTLTKMLDRIENLPMAAYIEGVELGRRNTPYVGAWIVDNLKEPTVCESLMPTSKHIQSIDAGGLYCCLVRADLYKKHEFEPFDKQGTNGLSCDVNFGVWLSRQGYRCYIDWSIQCDHIGDKGSVNLGNTKPRQVMFERRNKEWAVWTV